MTQPEPSQQVRDLVAAGKKIEAIKIFHRETGLDLKAAKAIIEGMERGTYGPLSARRPPMQVHRKRGSRAAVMRWYRKDSETMAREGYVEVSHQMDGVARGCGALFLPKQSEMVVTYQRID